MGVELAPARLVIVENTLHLDELEVAEALLPEVQANPSLQVLSGPYALAFDAAGNLLRPAATAARH